MIRRRLHCLGDGAPRANPFGEDTGEAVFRKLFFFTPSFAAFQSPQATSWSLSMNTSNIHSETLDYAGSWSWPLPNESVMSGKLSQ